MNTYSSGRFGALVLSVAVLLFLGPVEVHAFGDAADQMCNHPEKFIDGKPSSYKETNPQSPDYGKSGVVGQPCNDGTMASGYCLTIVKSGDNTGCKATKCGGTECKQAKPGEQQQPPEQPKPEDQQGQEQGKQDQKPPQMPEMPKGGGGDKPKPPEQAGKEDCVMSGALGMPCAPRVSTQLGSNQSATQDPAKLLRALGGGDESATQDTTSSGQQGFLERVRAGAGDFFEKLLARTPEVSDDSSQSQGSVIPTVPGVTFGSPESGSFSLEPTTVGQRVISWFQNLFK